MSQFVYTHDHYSDWSEAIDNLFYNEDEQKLVVETIDGGFYGYSNVTKEIYDAMVLEDSQESRDQGGSLGRYWNLWIKAHKDAFPGFSVDEDDIVPKGEGNENVLDSADVDATSDYYAQASNDSFGLFKEFVVGFELTVGTGDEALVSDNEVLVFAHDRDQALVAFQNVVTAAQYPKVKVTSLTEYYN